MKKILLSAIVFAALSFSAFAQSPEAFKYQAVVRDVSQNVIANQAVGMQLTILQTSATGTMVYQETFAPTSNAYGLVNLEIGTGTVVSGTFATIDWSAGPYFIETAMDATGGTTYVVMGTSQLLSVPYALHAKTAGSVANDMVNDADSVIGNEYNTTVALNGTDLETTDGGGTITTDLSSLAVDNINDADSVIGNEYNTTVVLNGTDLETTDGGGIITTDLSSLAVDNINDADSVIGNEYNTTVALNGTNLETTDGGGIITTDLSSLMVGADTLWTATGNDISNTNTGNVGIGTTNPVQKLDVVGNINLDATGELRWLNVNTIGMRREGEYISVLNESRIGMFIDANSNQTNGYFAVYHDGTNDATASELFRIQENGNVGIGTTTPSARLEVVGAANTDANSATWTPATVIDNAAGSTQMPIELRVGGTQRASLRADVFGNLSLSATGTGSVFLGGGSGNVIFANNTVYDGANGRLGLGTTTPAEKLDVNGNITLTGEIIQDPWINITLLNSWTYFGAPYATAQYYKDKEGVVHVKGLVTGGNPAVGVVLFNLPAGYRPTERRIMSGLTNGAANGVTTRIDVMTNGDVVIFGSNVSNFWINMEFSFRP
jgi:hypothetical protein